MINLVTMMQNENLMLIEGFNMAEEDDRLEVNDDRYLSGTVSSYTLKKSNLKVKYYRD